MTETGKIPLRTRLKVWWEGYDLNDVKQRLKAAEQAKARADAAPPPPAQPIDEVLPVEPWDDRRIEIAQYIWGEGYCGPGGPEHVIAMSKLLALSPEMSAMVIGAGLGGPSRVLASEFGVWITGFEESAKLAAAGMELSMRSGLAKKAEIRHYNPKNPEFDRNFDRAFAKEALFAVENKSHLVKYVHKKLKDEGLFLMTDYFLGRESVVNHPDYLEWKTKEPERPYPVPAGEMLEILKAEGFSIRVNEDVTQNYVTMISRAWAEADRVIANLMRQGEEGKQLVQVLVREAEFWSRRSRLLQSNILQVHRILAAKKLPKTMSNW